MLAGIFSNSSKVIGVTYIPINLAKLCWHLKQKKAKMFKIFRRLRLLEGILSCFSTAKSWISCQFSLRLHSTHNSQNTLLKRRLATEMQYSF